ncbi:MAG: hypothetical protein ABI664_13820 [bacterium]
MASQDKAETELDARYGAPAKSIASCVAEITKLLDVFLGPTFRADGSATWKGTPNETRRYTSLPDWSAAITTTPAFANLYVTAESNFDRRLAFFLDAHGTQIKVAAADTELEAARTLMRELEILLGLEPEEEAPERDRASSECEYLYLKPETPAALKRILAGAAAIATPNPRTWISIRMQDNAAIQLQSLDDPRFEQILDTRWAEIIGVDCDLDARRIATRFNFRLSDSTLRVHVEAKSADKAKESLETIEKEGALEPLPRESAFKGRSSLFSPKSALDAKWFARATKALASSIPAAAYSNCGYRLIESPNDEIVNRDFREWSAAVIDAWDGVANAHCWLDGRVARASMRIDPRRERVELSIEATTDARADAIIAALVRDLDLEVAREASPNRRTAASFTIERWGNKPFAQALDAALKRVFDERSPAIEEAYVEELVGEEVDRQPYSDLRTLLTRLEKPALYAAVGLRTVARDDAFSIALTPKKGDGLRTLELKSTFGPQEFPDLVGIFDRKVGLEPIPASGGGSGEKPAATKSDKAFDWRQLIISAIIGGAFTSAFWLAIIPTTTLEITVPAHVGDTDVAMPAGLDSVRVEWVIKRTQFGQTKILQNVEANVRVLRTSGQAIHTASGQGRISVPVVTGQQVIEVKTPSGDERAVLRILVPKAAAPPQD